MRKLLFLITLLCLLFISGCEVPPTESYISNIKESKYVVTWDEDLSSTLYYINITSDVSSSVTFTTTDTSYDLSSYIDGLLIKNNEFTLTVKVKSNSTTSVYKEEITITVEKELPTLPIAPIPTNVKIENNILTWDNMNNVNTYEVTITLNDLVDSYTVSTNSFDFTSYLSISGTYYFQVKSLISDSYSNDSEYCKVVAYEYEEIVIEKEIFNYNFLTMESLPTGFSATSFAKYADKSVKFNSSGFYLTTNSFKALKSFSVTATIKGNGCSGDATITFYGLDDSNKIIETYPITYAITNSKHDITAEFNNTSITKIKLEYTTKATGNFGLYNLSANHDEESDRITSISLEEYQTSYLQNQPFDYSGNLIVNYKSGAVKKHKLNDVKDQLTISQFSTTSKGTYTSVLSYEGFKANFTYNVKYDYDAYYTYADDIKIYTFDLNDTADNLFVMLSITQDEETINVLFDYNKKTTIDIINNLLLEISSYTSNKVDYAYSVNNANLFTDSKPLNNTTQYNFAPDVYVTVNNNEFNIDVYGFNYYFTLDTITKTNKVDILHVNSDIDIDTLKVVDPTNVILQEGTINDLVENGMAVYSYNNQIYQYAPTLSNSFFYTFTKNTYTIDGDNLLELSSNTAWSDAETNGLHHKDLNNYVYRISYYGDISNLYGNELLNSIKNTITKTHTTLVNYAYAKTAYKLTDADPLKPGNIITFYSNTSINGTWENGITWNREHVWPKSLSGGIYNTLDDSDKNAGTDLHHIRPALTSINSSRGNKAYGTITNEQTFYPGDEFIGDTARILFYLSVRYDMSITGLKVCNDISLLLEWNNIDQVDNLERNRNASVQEIQGNFNPFIDNPWIAERIWQ
ncbi:MAG: endonuclease [Bacilli bacterium]|nr:endonuclease [Bacilli bacterium]